MLPINFGVRPVKQTMNYVVYCPAHLNEICYYIKTISNESAEGRNGFLSFYYHLTG